MNYQALLALFPAAQRQQINADLTAFAGGEGVGIALQEVLRYPQHSSQWIVDEQRALRTRHSMIATSLMHKKLMKAVLTPWVVAFLLNKQPSTADIHLTEDAPHRLIVHRNDAATLTPQWLSDTSAAFAEHMQFFHRLSPAISYGNAALAIAQPWIILAKHKQHGHAVADSVTAFFATLSPALDSALEWMTIDKTTRSATYPRRNSCCLKYRLPNKAHCGTCDKISATERRQQKTDAL